jgi:hypothetical protein
MPKRIKDKTLSHIKDVDIVRWAHVRALLMHGLEMANKRAEKVHNNAVIEELRTASPEALVDMLGIDLPFARRVSKVVRENEQTRHDTKG